MQVTELPERIDLPRLPLAWDRKCLQQVLRMKDEQASPQKQLDWLQQQLVERASRIHEGEEEERRLRQQGQKLAPDLRRARYEVSCFLNYLEDSALFRLLGCDSMYVYRLAHWPGKKIGLKQLRKYLLVARFIPEPVLDSDKAGITLLADVANVRHAQVIDLLCDAIQSDTEAELVRDGATKARQLLDQDLPLDVVLKKTRDVVEGRKDPEEERAATLLEAQRLWRKAQRQGISRAEWDLAMSLMGPGGPPADRPPAGPPGGKERRNPPRQEEPVAAAQEARTEEPVPAPPPPAPPESKTEEPVPPTPSADPVSPVPQDPTGPPAQELWWGERFTRALLRVLDGPESQQLQHMLVRALRGEQPAPMISLLRDKMARLSGEDPEVREDLSDWMKCACNWKLESRWPYLYMFFVIAQLPHFRLFLHGLAHFGLPPSCQQMLEVACTVFPLLPPPDIPDGATKLEQDAIRLAHQAQLINQVYYELFAVPFECDVELLAALWERVCDLRDELEKLLSDSSQDRMAASCT